MAAHDFDRLTERLADVSSRRSVVKGIGALAAGAAGLVGLTEATSARRRRRRNRNNNRGSDKLDRSCVNHCLNQGRNDCHEKCRRD